MNRFRVNLVGGSFFTLEGEIKTSKEAMEVINNASTLIGNKLYFEINNKNLISIDKIIGIDLIYPNEEWTNLSK